MTTHRTEDLAAGDMTTWLRDEATGLVTNNVYADGRGPAYGYTPDGRLSRRTWARGVTTDYSYDALGRFASVSSGTNVFAYSYLPGSSLVSGMTANTGHAWERIYKPDRDLIATVHNRYPRIRREFLHLQIDRLR